jgi:hypothetical protein
VPLEACWGRAAPTSPSSPPRLSDTGSDGGRSDTIRRCWFGVSAVTTRIGCLSAGIDAAGSHLGLSGCVSRGQTPTSKRSMLGIGEYHVAREERRATCLRGRAGVPVDGAGIAVLSGRASLRVRVAAAAAPSASKRPGHRGRRGVRAVGSRPAKLALGEGHETPLKLRTRETVVAPTQGQDDARPDESSLTEAASAAVCVA